MKNLICIILDGMRILIIDIQKQWKKVNCVLLKAVKLYYKYSESIIR